MPTQAQRLIYAVRRRKNERLRQLLKKYGDVDARSSAGRTALHAAAEQGDIEATRTLMEAGADVNARMADGITPLHQAAANGGYRVLDDIDIDRRDPCRRKGRTGVKLEVAEVMTQIIKERHPSIRSDIEPEDILNSEDKAEAFSATFDLFSEPKELYKEIVARGVDLDRVDPDFAESLKGKPRFFKLTQFLLDHGADPNAVDKHGNSVLRGAVELGRADTVKLLLERGVNLNGGAAGNTSAKLIEFALERYRVDVAETLLNHGAKYTAEDAGSWLHEAAGNGRETVVAWLLDRGVDINTRNERGRTPLLTADGHASVMELLIKRGADVLARDNEGRGLLHSAAAWKPCLEVVRGIQLPVNEQDKKGQTPLHIAAQSLNADGIQMLMERGAIASLPGLRQEYLRIAY